MKTNDEKTLENATNDNVKKWGPKMKIVNNTTPRPWKFNRAKKLSDLGACHVVSQDNIAVADCCDFEDAKLIVNAVNSHDALVMALKNTLEAFKAFTNVRDGDIVDQAAQALALAEGKGV